MKNKVFTYNEAIHLALEVFPMIATRKPIREALAQAAKEEGYSEGSFRRRFYAWDKAMMSHPSDGGILAVLKPSERTKEFTSALRLPLTGKSRFCRTVLSYESFVSAYDETNHFMPRCKESKLKRLYELFRFLSEHPIVFHWETIVQDVRAFIKEYKDVRHNTIADDLFLLYKMGVLIVNPPL